MRIKGVACPACSHVLKAVAAVGLKRTPHPKAGDTTVCAKCTCILIFTRSLRLRELTAPELERMPVQVRERLLQTQKALQALRVHTSLAQMNGES